jgi:thioredoxin reductase (NADPH)
VKLNKSNNKILGGKDGELEKTDVNNIYAIGDVLEGVPELTPVA